MKRKTSAFTLIEIIVVIGVIGLIASIILVSLVTARDKARDSKRKIEISQIGKFLSFSCYLPTSGDGEYDLADILDELKDKYPKYAETLSATPKDPRLGTDEETYYKYIVSDSGSKCALYANLEHEDEPVTLTDISSPTPKGGTGVFEAPTSGWNGTKKYFQVSN
jgi:prepilin-type N-terminal cleavage/methylation domain-containing protein